ncbi:MAG: hypothetical protein ACU0BZ_07670 [Paracoccus sp. (in: a-proteobacteria)]|nr:MULTISPECIES: hypothetical protein [unclassified Paracoccus (in: a-proteobacteria)]
MTLRSALFPDSPDGARTGAAQGGQAAGLWRDRQSTFDSAAAFVS